MADDIAPGIYKGTKHPVVLDLHRRFGEGAFVFQPTVDDVPTLWVQAGQVRDILTFLKTGVERPYRMLYDITGIDERLRKHREGQPPSDWTVVYHLLSIDRNSDVRLKVALTGEKPELPSCVSIFANANWYERE